MNVTLPTKLRSYTVADNFSFLRKTELKQIPLCYFIADRFEAGRRPAASWNLAYHLAR